VITALISCAIAQNDDCEKPQVDPMDDSLYGFCGEKKPITISRQHATTHQQAIENALALERVGSQL